MGEDAPAGLGVALPQRLAHRLWSPDPGQRCLAPNVRRLLPAPRQLWTAGAWAEARASGAVGDVLILKCW